MLPYQWKFQVLIYLTLCGWELLLRGCTALGLATPLSVPARNCFYILSPVNSK